MSLTLSSNELEQLTRALSLLVSPLDHATVDEWRSLVNRELKQLLHADSAGFLLPVTEGLPLFSEEHDPAELARYPDYPPPPLVDGTALWEKMIQEGVMTLAEAYGCDYGVYLNSAYYQEYAGANGAHDTLAAAISLGGTDARGMAALHFWHAAPNGRLFGEREIALMRVLFPAFRAGVEAQVLWGGYRTDLLDTLDALGQPVLVCDLTGRPVHQTPALTALLEADPEVDTLRAELVAATNAVRKLVRIPTAGGQCALANPLVTQVRTSFAGYAIRVSLYGGASAGTMPVILIALERRTPVPRTEAELREDFELTRAEVRVARLIAQGRSNAEIADELFISPHTARRHTERVLLKLKVRSRAEVGPKLLC